MNLPPGIDPSTNPALHSCYEFLTWQECARGIASQSDWGPFVLIALFALAAYLTAKAKTPNP